MYICTHHNVNRCAGIGKNIGKQKITFMENNKYYTPSIEEFHVGFEYESKTLKKDKWTKRICTIIDIQELEEAFKHDSTIARVKILDREDIEACGWTYTGELDTTLPWTYKRQYNDHYIAYLHTYLDTNGDPVIMITGSDYGETALVVKNKSELKKLMKQIKIA